MDASLRTSNAPLSREAATLSRMAVRSLIASAAAFLLCTLVLAGIFLWNFGRHTQDTYARCALVDIKARAINALPHPRLVFIGGSSVHWGVNAQLAGEKLGAAGGNFGTYAALGPELLIWSAKKTLKPGDTAVLMLEYEHYGMAVAPADAISFAMACEPDFIWSLSPLQLLRTLFAFDPWRVFDVWAWSRKTPPDMYFSVASGHADAPTDPAQLRPVPQEQIDRLKLYRPMPMRFNPEGVTVRAVTAFRDWAKANNVRLIAAWPNTIYFPEYENARALREIRAFYDGLGIPVAGTAVNAMLPLAEFRDTQYHLNPPGIRIRTERVIEELRPLMTTRP